MRPTFSPEPSERIDRPSRRGNDRAASSGTPGFDASGFDSTGQLYGSGGDETGGRAARSHLRGPFFESDDAPLSGPTAARGRRLTYQERLAGLGHISDRDDKDDDFDTVFGSGVFSSRQSAGGRPVSPRPTDDRFAGERPTVYRSTETARADRRLADHRMPRDHRDPRGGDLRTAEHSDGKPKQPATLKEHLYGLSRDLGLFFVAMAVTVIIGSIFMAAR